MSNKVKLNLFARGFSLVEMAIVLTILGIVIGALLLPVKAQREQLFQSQTNNLLEISKKSLLGYAQSQGRLPCPAIAAAGPLQQRIATNGLLHGLVLSLATSSFHGLPCHKAGRRAKEMRLAICVVGKPTKEEIVQADGLHARQSVPNHERMPAVLGTALSTTAGWLGRQGPANERRSFDKALPRAS